MDVFIGLDKIKRNNEEIRRLTDMILNKKDSEIRMLQYVLNRIISDLPQKRDWLDPEIERIARQLLKKTE